MKNPGYVVQLHVVVSPTADPEVLSSIPARSLNFVV